MKFMLQPHNEAFWRAAEDHEENLLSQFCERNEISRAHLVGGVLSQTGAHGTAEDSKEYTPVAWLEYTVSVQGSGASAQLFLTRKKEGPMIARPYEARFIDPRLRAPEIRGFCRSPVHVQRKL